MRGQTARIEGALRGYFREWYGNFLESMSMIPVRTPTNGEQSV